VIRYSESSSSIVLSFSFFRSLVLPLPDFLSFEASPASPLFLRFDRLEKEGGSPSLFSSSNSSLYSLSTSLAFFSSTGLAAAVNLASGAGAGAGAGLAGGAVADSYTTGLVVSG